MSDKLPRWLRDRLEAGRQAMREQDVDAMTVCLVCGSTDDTCPHAAAWAKRPPGTPGFCACGGFILADTEGWDEPRCADCWEELGCPDEEPAKA